MADAARSAALALSLLPSLAWGQPLQPEAPPAGVLTVVDGDTLKVGRARLQKERGDA
jgi:endonuclease YncB( thermonuclease family)